MLEKKDKKFSIIKDIAIIVIGVVLIWFAVKVVFNVDNPFYVVSSGSMIPVLNVGDILIVKDGNTFDSLKIGDIIVFDRPEGGDRVIVHRIIDMTDRFGEKIIVTKGDANEGLIPGTDFPIREKDYIGIEISQSTSQLYYNSRDSWSTNLYKFQKEK